MPRSGMIDRSARNQDQQADRPQPGVTTPPPPRSPAAMSRQSTRIALLVASAFSWQMLDGTVIVAALPQMARSFGVNPVDLDIVRGRPTC